MSRKGFRDTGRGGASRGEARPDETLDDAARLRKGLFEERLRGSRPGTGRESIKQDSQLQGQYESTTRALRWTLCSTRSSGLIRSNHMHTTGKGCATRDSRHTRRWKWAADTDLAVWKTWRQGGVQHRTSMLSALTSDRSSSRIRFALDRGRYRACTGERRARCREIEGCRRPESQRGVVPKKGEI
jgi:hypothetical protein